MQRRRASPRSRPTPFTSSNEVGLTKEKADELGVKKISDLAGKDQDLTLYGSPECRQREDCLLGLQQVYGLDFKKFTPVDDRPAPRGARQGAGRPVDRVHDRPADQAQRLRAARGRQGHVPAVQLDVLLVSETVEKGAAVMEQVVGPGPEGPDRRGDAGAERPRRPRQEDAGAGGRRVPEGVGPGQLTPESVWDYPRPPRVEACARRAAVESAARSWPTPAVCGCWRPARRRRSTSRPRTCGWTSSSRSPSGPSANGRASRRTSTSWSATAAAEAAAWAYPEPVEDFAELTRPPGLLPAARRPLRARRRTRWSPTRATSTAAGSRRDIQGPFKGAPGTGELVSAAAALRGRGAAGARPARAARREERWLRCESARTRWPTRSVAGGARRPRDRAGGRLRRCRWRRRAPSAARRRCARRSRMPPRCWPSTRPTAVNLRVGARSPAGGARRGARARAPTRWRRWSSARGARREAIEADRASGGAGRRAIRRAATARSRTATPGPLATGGYGTAAGVLRRRGRTSAGRGVGVRDQARCSRARGSPPGSSDGPASRTGW